MKTKKMFSVFLLFTVLMTKAQITAPFPIPDTIPNYDGSYDQFGQGHLFYPNDGEVRFADEEQTDAWDAVRYYTMNTHPRKYLLNNNNLSLCYAKNNQGYDALVDSLHRIDIEWSGSTGTPFLARVDTQKFARLNYFTHLFDSAGRKDVRGSAAIACQSIYNNIDLVYTSNNAGIVMYFIVYPGGDPNDITLHFGGSKSNSIVGNKLVAKANWDEFTLQRPQMYQYTYVNNVVTPVLVCNAAWATAGAPDSYVINNSTSYNPALPLIIQIKEAQAVNNDEPGLCWSTYFGGWQFDFLTKTHCDVYDNFYIGGNTNSSGLTFPQAQGLQQTNPQAGDGVISKFNSSGILQWSTFIGGASNDYIRDFDFYGNDIFCVGRTNSSNLLTQPKSSAFNDATFGAGNGTWDGFICQFEFIPATGLVQKKWLTYFGGNGEDDLHGCKVDASGNLYIVGASASSDIPSLGSSGAYIQTYNTAQLNPGAPLSTDAIIGKFNPNGSQAWFTFFGTDALGTNAHSHAGDYFYGLTIAGNDVYACGKAGGTNLPNSINSKFVSGNFDGILAHFTTGGILNNSKYTDGNIVNYAVKELWTEIYTVGEANSSMNPVNSGLYYYNGSSSGTSDACFSVHDANLSTTTHNSFLGGSGDDAAYDIQFAKNNVFYIAGGTNSGNFPVTSLGSMYQSNAKGIGDNFIACFGKGNTNINWSSYLGSFYAESLTSPPYITSAFDLANTTISLDSKNRVRLLGTTNCINNSFPADDGGGVPYFQAINGGALDGSITCFDFADIDAIVGMKDFEDTKFVFGIYPNPTSKVGLRATPSN